MAKRAADRCICCGRCKAVCPVFKATRDEAYSLRGRAQVMKRAGAEGSVLYTCLSCGACSLVCPGQVAEGLEEERERRFLRERDERRAMERKESKEEG